MLALIAWILVAQSSPGPLAASHAHLESTCEACHRAGAPTTNADCASCHEALLQKGLHASAVVRGACTSCHREHRGRSADLQAWSTIGGAATFDHAALANWPLDGPHGAATCVRCHATKTVGGSVRYSGLTGACASCHVVPAHASPRFDQLACERCHAAARRTWKNVVFDHDAQTKFPLDRGHRVACARCHTGAAKPSTRCEDCHPAKPHGARFAAVPGGCATCHTAVGWKRTRFAHAQHTRFALTAKHATIACNACHRGPQFERLQTGCKECHAHTKVHADEANPNGKFTTQQCSNCHVQNLIHPPRPPMAFYHGPRSTFPLVKGHRDVPCVDCHTKRNANGKTSFDPISRECGDGCHADAAHGGALGATCTTCHVSGTWDAIAFDHAKRYALEGHHRDVACAGCHGADKRFAGAPRRCAGCHARDDVHRGALGGTCDRCHLPTGDNRFSHALMSTFTLDGKHLAVACEDCHPTRVFRPRPRTCGGCHPDPAIHKSMYGTHCARCHTTASWQPR